MRLCVVKNEASEYLTSLVGTKPVFGKLNADCVVSERDAQIWANEAGGHAVPLAELEPVEVSEEEAEMLEALKDGDLMPIGELSYFIGHAEQLTEKESIAREDRLMRAYVNGWTVKPKLWNVKVPHTDGDLYWQDAGGVHANDDNCVTYDFFEFTLTEIHHYGLDDCERIPVAD